MITLTEKAVAQIKEISAAEEIGHTTVRIGVKGGGCAGYMTDMSFDDQVKDTDEIFEQDGVKVVVDMMSIHYLEGTQIDYVQSLMGAGFKFNNPNVQHSCGCGKSWA
jgi:iron-sulfur cluster assembly accessory protein